LKIKYSRIFKTTYNSIHDIPIYFWFKLRSEEDLRYLFQNKKYHNKPLNENDAIYLKSLYFDLITEFFKEFGQQKKYKNELELMLKITKLNIKFLETGDRFLLNQIEIFNDRLEKMRLDNIDKSLNLKKEDIEKENKKQIAIVSKALHTIIDVKRISVVQFYTILTNNEQ